jgi:hypothetical protein
MNSIRALNVRPGIQEMPGSLPNPEPDTGAPSSRFAPAKGTAQPVPEEAADASSCGAALHQAQPTYLSKSPNQ